MPSDLFNRGINMDLFYPPFLAKLLELKANCAARGKRYLCTYGFRTMAESDILHNHFLQGGPRAAPGGYSSHNFGLASDEALIIRELGAGNRRVLSWGSKANSVFEVLGEEAAKLGLHWGKLYSDEPHISWPGFVSGAELAPLRDAWHRTPGDDLTRLKEVWKYVDLHSPTQVTP